MADVSLGGLYDRLSILALKIVAAQEAGKPCQHFRDEFHRIAEEINQISDGRDMAELGGFLGVLDRTNRELWAATARMEAVTAVTDLNAYDVAYTALAIRDLNRERSRAKEAIDKAAGVWRGPEKV